MLLLPSLVLTYLNIYLIAKHKALYATIRSWRHYWLPAVMMMMMMMITSKALTVFPNIIKKGHSQFCRRSSKTHNNPRHTPVLSAWNGVSCCIGTSSSKCNSLVVFRSVSQCSVYVRTNRCSFLCLNTADTQFSVLMAYWQIKLGF